MIYTDNYYRWKRVEEVSQTPTGILAELHGEQLSIDVVRADLLRIKISRGGSSMIPNLRGVCDPLAAPARLQSSKTSGHAVDHKRVHRLAVAGPFRIVHRGVGRR
jgi:hypothetical protein